MEQLSKNIIHEGKRLKQIVRDKRIKILAFAKMADFSNQIAHYYFKEESIKRSKLTELCTVLGITLEEFYNWEHIPKASQRPTEVHHGQRLNELIGEKGLNKTRLAERMEISRRALYNLVEKATFTPAQMKAVCQVLDMTPKEFINGQVVEEPGNNYQVTDVWKEKYYQLLEQHNQLLLELAKLKGQ